MTAKQYLRQIKDLDIRADNYRRYYERCLRDIALLKSPRYDSDKVQASVSGAGFTTAVEKLVDAQAEANRMVDQFIDQRNQIVKEISSLEYPYSEILYKRYVEYKSFDTIAEEMILSYSRITTLHGEALKRFEMCYLRIGKEDAQ